MDDFIQLGQGGPKRMRGLRDHLLHTIDDVLAQPLPNESHRAEAVSLKKLLKGDGSWGTHKLILGWIIDTLRQTLEIPAYRKTMLANVFVSRRPERPKKSGMETVAKHLRPTPIRVHSHPRLCRAIQRPTVSPKRSTTEPSEGHKAPTPPHTRLR